MTPENAEDVSFDFVPGSVGSAGALVTPWTARRRPEFDRVRAVEMEKIKAMLAKPSTSAKSARNVTAQDYQKAIEPFQRAVRPMGRRA